MSERVEVSGLRELRTALRRLDRALPREVKRALNNAAQIVADDARPRVPVGPAAGGHARTSIRAASTARAGRVKGGGARFSYYPWLEYGGRVGPRASVRRPRVQEGRYIWPAYMANRGRVRDEAHRGLEDVARRAGLNVRIGGR